MMIGKGEITLAAGRGSVDLPRISKDAVVVLSPMTLLGTVGALAWSINPQVGFSIVSLSALDLSIIRWVVFV